MIRTIYAACTFILSMTLIVSAVHSQDYPKWEGYPAMSEMSDLVLFGDSIYGATSTGLFSYDVSSGDYIAYYRNHGLDAGGLRAVAASDRYIYIGFEHDGLMRFDPITGRFEPILFPEYINEQDVTQSLAINDIIALSDSVLFVAHDEGIDRLDMVTEELHTYTQLSYKFDHAIPVNELELFDGKLWAGTAQGLAWADIDDPSLESPDTWESFVFDRSYRPTAVNAILKHVRGPGDSLIIVGTGRGGVIEFNPATGDTMTTLATTNIRSLAHGFGTVIAGSLYEGYFVQTGDTTWVKEDSLKVYMRMESAPDGNVWVATGEDGLQHITEEGLDDIPRINLPSFPTIRDIEVASTGAVWISTADRDEGGHIQVFNDDQWLPFILKEPLQFRVTNALALDSYDRLWGACWATTVYTGDISVPFVDFPESIVEVDPDHEFILPYQPGSSYIVNPDITVDAYDNIWIAGFTNGLYVFDGELPVADNPHHQFVFDDATASPAIVNVHVDPDGWIWLGTYETGLIGQWVGSDPFDTSDDKRVYFDKNYEDNDKDKLLGTGVYTAVPDLDHDVWVGTDGGLNRIVKKSNGTFDIIDESRLLDNNIFVVHAVAIDPAGSKWIGTEGGLYRINHENEQVAVYTVENSGLISNLIYSVAYDPVENRMLIGTDKGLNVFNVFGENGDPGDIVSHVYPNPFEIWGTDSRATFEGLAEDTLLRIFTATGELVVELEPKSNGGTGVQAVWDGCNYRGEFVGSGVYFYTGYTNTGDQIQPFRSKMAVIRR